MEEAIALFMAKLGNVTKSDLAVMSGMTYDQVRYRAKKEPPLTRTGKAFWFLLTGSIIFGSTSEEERVAQLTVKSTMLKQSDLLKLLGVHAPESPVYQQYLLSAAKKGFAPPKPEAVKKAVDHVPSFGVGYLLTEQTYAPILEGSRFSPEELAETQKLLREVVMRVYIASHQSLEERRAFLDKVEGDLNSLYLNLEALGNQTPFLAAKEIGNYEIKEILGEKENGE